MSSNSLFMHYVSASTDYILMALGVDRELHRDTSRLSSHSRLGLWAVNNTQSPRLGWVTFLGPVRIVAASVKGVSNASR